MNPADHDYDEACRAGNPATYIAALDDVSLGLLCRHAEGIMRGNDAKGGIPAIIKWSCVIEAAKRFLQTPMPHDPR